jgi:polyisoprenyl-teichoic acid--peptidoglycan teichoic acid transferase
MSSPYYPTDDERPPSPRRGTWLRFAIAGLVIVVLSGAATATVATNEIKDVAEKVFPKKNQIHVAQGVVKPPEYSGAPETFLVLGSDRRAKAKNSFERGEPHSDTILLVRFDPKQGQTSVLSIPRDLMVNIRTPEGAYYPNEKINAAYTLGSRLKGTDGGSALAAETIEREVFPGLKLNGIIDVNFKGFIEVVDTLGCAYVNVDHRYLGGGSVGEDFSSIDLQPGYQKLCYENALSYVRFRHFDSDFVRVARQQDFLRDLREQVNPELSQIDKVAKAVGHAIHSTFNDSNDELIELSKLIAFSQGKPLRQVHFLASNVNAQLNGGSYVTSTPEL